MWQLEALMLTLADIRLTKLLNERLNSCGHFFNLVTSPYRFLHIGVRLRHKPDHEQFQLSLSRSIKDHSILRRTIGWYELLDTS
jgi:hypothetical protein